jgi:thiol:disulfide interchange protein
METMQNPLTSSPPMARRRGRSWLWLGVGVFLLGLVLYILQAFLFKILVVPWYMPIMFTMGALFALVAFGQRRTWTRGIALVLLGLLCAGEWFFILSLSRLPEYKGPAQVDRQIPEFTTTLADGTPFTKKDLQKGTATVLVFYRGHW